MTISIPLADIDSYQAYDGTSSFRQLTIDSQFNNGHVVFSGLPLGAEARVYAVDGRLVDCQQADK